jgi:predicted secreted Zn-dependent protease
MLGLFCLIWAGSVAASAQVTEQREAFPVSGRTGPELARSLSREGPRLGLFKKTSGAVKSTITTSLNYEKRGRECRIANASSRIVLIYKLPHATERLEPGVRKKWDRFIAVMRTRLQNHKTIAQAHRSAMDRALTGIYFANDPRCLRVAAEAKRRSKGINKEYDKRHEMEMKNNTPAVLRHLGELEE